MTTLLILDDVPENGHPRSSASETGFFSDPDLFKRLQREVNSVLARVPAEEEIRIWAAGCGTGEDVYSLAILFHESLLAAKRPINITIFATDAQRATIESASAGVYDQAALRDLSLERLERYFARHAVGYQVSHELHGMIVFASHNVVADLPFIAIDMISCRNLVAHLSLPEQKEALSLFHFGLKTAGVLVLGQSESLGDLTGEFDSLDDHWRIYRKRRDIRLPTAMQLPPPATRRSSRPTTAGAQQSSGQAVADIGLAQAYDELLVTYVPPSLLVNMRRELLHAFAGAGQFLRVPDGRPPCDILEMVDGDLASAISGALEGAIEGGVPIAGGGYHPGGPNGTSVQVCVRPMAIRSSGETYYLISLESERRPEHCVDPMASVAPGQVDQAVEADSAGLQAAHDELASANEKLQSSNDQLHAANQQLLAASAEKERKIAELTQLTDDMDNLLHSTEVGTIFLDRDLLIRKSTPTIAHAFQLLPQDFGRRIECFAHNILHEHLLEDVQRVLETEETIERDVQDRLGEWYLLRILPYRTRSKVEGVVVTLIAISRLKKTEQELRRLSKVFMDGADPIIIEDLSGRIVDMNREAERAYGWTRTELLGKCTSVLVPPSLQAQHVLLRDKCRADDSVRNVESVRRDRNGLDSPVLLTLSLLSDDSGRPAAMASISKDIAEQKKAEWEAREASTRRDQFLAMLSHELRNPLGALLSATQLLSRAGGDGHAFRQASTVIERQAKHMARLLDDLLDVARVTQGKIHIRNEVVDLRAIANQAVQVVEPLLEKGQHSLTVIHSSLPIYVEGDSARLLQVHENLLTNAVKYTPPGGRIRMSTCVEDGEAVVRFRDNGVGIDPEMRSRIFELFYQGPKTLERFDGGMGIGLTMVQEIVQLHGGCVSVSSAGAGTGSEFEVRLPLTKKPLLVTQAAPATKDTNLRVLIVEDNADSRELLQSLLTLDGYLVSTMPDGIAGYEAIEKERPDVALIDVGLPGIDGYEVARRVRRQLADRNIKLVALTGYGRAEDRAAVAAAGFDEHLVKPVDPADLARVLCKAR